MESEISDHQIKDYIRIEEELIEEFVRANPYPEYTDIRNDLLDKSEKINNLDYLDMFAEYGEPNHNYCKEIYDNPNNQSLIINMGKNIYNRGGIPALTWNLRVLKLIYSRSTNNIIRGHSRIIESYFSEVCDEWKD
tara:strand:+ start:161 stop:568 length:408 start_codon:yes stop_codon:yes gene_type:complete